MCIVTVVGDELTIEVSAEEIGRSASWFEWNKYGAVAFFIFFDIENNFRSVDHAADIHVAKFFACLEDQFSLVVVIE